MRRTPSGPCEGCGARGTRTGGPDPGAGTGTSTAALVALGAEAIAVEPGPGRLTEPRRSLPETAADSFYGTGLPGLLRKQGVTRIVVTGCKSEFCVDTAGRQAAGLGFDVTLLTGCHFLFADPGHWVPGTLPSPRCRACRPRPVRHAGR